MPSAALCFAPQDEQFASEAQRYLCANSALHIELAGSKGHQHFLDVVEQCLTKEFAIVIVSLAAVPTPWPRSLWEPVLVDSTRESGCKVAFMLLGDCSFPVVLRRRACFESLQQLRRWVIQECRTLREPPLVTGSCEQDEALLVRVDHPGVIKGVSRSAANWLITNYWRDFENVYRVPCARQSRAGIIGEMGVCLNLRLSGTVEENWNSLVAIASEERALFALENLCDEFQYLAELGGKASVMVLAQDDQPETLSIEQLRQLFFEPNADEAQCLRALGRLMDSAQDAGDWAAVKAIGFRALLYLRRQGRLAEELELLQWLAPQALKHLDWQTVHQIHWDEDWILTEWGLPLPQRAEPTLEQPSQLPLPLFN